MKCWSSLHCTFNNETGHAHTQGNPLHSWFCFICNCIWIQLPALAKEAAGKVVECIPNWAFGDHYVTPEKEFQTWGYIYKFTYTCFLDILLLQELMQHQTRQSCSFLTKELRPVLKVISSSLLEYLRNHQNRTPRALRWPRWHIRHFKSQNYKSLKVILQRCQPAAEMCVPPVMSFFIWSEMKGARFEMKVH